MILLIALYILALGVNASSTMVEIRRNFNKDNNFNSSYKKDVAIII
ncbi:hypothetical protein [Flavobacterium sp. XS2P14]